MLAREQNVPADQHEKLNIINRSGEHLLDMINDILDLSKIEAGQSEFRAEAFDLHRMLEDIGSIFKLRAKGADLRFTLDFDAKLPRYVTGDALKLRQILNNLLSNAVKYTANGGIVLRAHSMPAPDDPAMVRLQLTVEDSGQGISPELQEHIFEPFFQTGNTQAGSTGTGLGLAISRSYVETMNGRIAVESTPGKGSLFKIDLPVFLAAAEEMVCTEAARTRVVGLEPGQPAWRILVAEDNRENRLLLIDLLRGAGLEVREARNGQESIDLFEQWQPHLIWMDMRMPVIDGYAATEKIRTLPGGDAVKIVAITASAFKEQRTDILAAGCDEVVYKPYRDHEIFETMARLLDIKYLYEQKSEPVSRKEKIDLTAEMLADLPGDLLQELREAILVLNRDAAFEAIARIADQAPEAAAGLRVLVENFQMVELRDLLGMRGTEND
jgi:CheY-like chemotaxis protein/two-component sensor histidine kinase